MNFVIHHFIDGTAFLVAGGLLLAGPLLPFQGKGGVARAIRIGVLLGVVAVVFSGTPLPLWFYAVWAAAILLWALVQGRSLKAPRRGILACRLGAAALAAAALAWEASWELLPSLELGPSQTVYVVGDSISAGLDPSRRGAWPEAMARRTGAKVVNLALAGAKVSGGVAQAAGVQEPNALVLIEIGGNDLMTTPAKDFHASLEGLLQSVQGPQRRVAMFELPSLPFGNSYLMAQRRLARRYGVILIPRRVLVNVWATPGATLDGVHLSPAGHEQLASSIARLLSRRG